MKLRRKKAKIRDRVAYKFNVVPVEIGFDHKTVVLKIEKDMLEKLYGEDKIEDKIEEIEETIEADIGRDTRVEVV